jgi:hypothetical protein
VSVDDRARNREPEAAPLPRILGGEERLEDAWQDRRRDPGSVIANHDRHLAPLPQQLDRERAAGPKGVCGIQEQIHEDLVQLGGIAAHLGHVVVARDDTYTGWQAMADQGDGTLEPGTERSEPELRAARRGSEATRLREQRHRSRGRPTAARDEERRLDPPLPRRGATVGAQSVALPHVAPSRGAARRRGRRASRAAAIASYAAIASCSGSRLPARTVSGPDSCATPATTPKGASLPLT